MCLATEMIDWADPLISCNNLLHRGCLRVICVSSRLLPFSPRTLPPAPVLTCDSSSSSLASSALLSRRALRSLTHRLLQGPRRESEGAAVRGQCINFSSRLRSQSSNWAAHKLNSRAASAASLSRYMSLCCGLAKRSSSLF